MSLHEHPSSAFPEYEIPDSLNDEVEGQVASEVFQAVCNQLATLNVVPAEKAMFSMFINDVRIRMFGIDHGIRIGGRDQDGIGQRIIFNREIETTPLEERIAHIDDFLISLETGSILHARSSTTANYDMENKKYHWDVPAECGPLILPQGADIKIHQGKRYNSAIYANMVMRQNNIFAFEELEAQLRQVTPAWRDDIEHFSIHFHG